MIGRKLQLIVRMDGGANIDGLKVCKRMRLERLIMAEISPLHLIKFRLKSIVTN